MKARSIPLNVTPCDDVKSMAWFIAEIVLMNPQLRLNGPDLLRNDEMVKDVETQDGEAWCISDEQYKRLTGYLDKIQGFGKVHVPFVRAILDAEVVEVHQTGE